jgi:MFS family permease
MFRGEVSRWPLYAVNGVAYVFCAILGSLLARRKGRRPWVWAIMCVPFSFLAVCYLYALEPSGVERTLAEDLNSAPL